MPFEWSATIEGRPSSKKNNRRNFGRVSLPSVAHEKFHASAMEQLQGHTPNKPFGGDVILKLDLYLKGKLAQDYDNAAGSIGDLLQDAGVVVNDDQIIEAHIFKHRGAKDWRSEVRVVSVER
jgi:Holliday junction resolvase RusA-like endonuclease